jgi:Enoyl-CoA hydratase/isomerase
MEWLTGVQFAELLASPRPADELGVEPGAVVVDWSDGIVPGGVVSFPTQTSSADRAGGPVPGRPAGFPDHTPVVDGAGGRGPGSAASFPGHTPAVIVGIAPASGDATIGALSDVIVPDRDAAQEVVAAVDAQPVAAAALAVLLRQVAQGSVVGDVVSESATYSALQASEGHRQWLAGRPPARPVRRDRPMVRATRNGERLDVVLACPERRNALSAQMRDELTDAFIVALADRSIDEVVWTAEGPAFCSGGDLDEFGSGTDPGANHVVRLARTVALTLAELADRVTAHVHGPCVGAGVELPAFARRVVAASDATFRLPELAMGLIPGAGGTASLPRRIGRHRTAWLALTGHPIDAPTAHHWGLVDTIAA